jgi:imidazolonepropionase-like amidohydrolase
MEKRSMRISSVPNLPSSSASIIRIVALALLVLACPVAMHSVNGQDKSDTKKDKEANKTADKDKPEIVAIVGGDIHTVTGPVVRKGTIVVTDGKITEIGQSVKVPEGAKVIDAAGKTITPGFVAINMSRVGIGNAPTGKDKLEDGLNPFDRNLKYSLGVGITSGCTELSGGDRGRRRGRAEGAPPEMYPGLEEPIEEYVTEAMMDYGDLDTALCPCCGLPVLPTEPIVSQPPAAPKPSKMAVLKMSYGDLDSMLVKENVFYSVSAGALNGALARHNFRKNLQIAREAIEAEKKAASEKKTSSKTSSRSTSSSTKTNASSKEKSAATASKSKDEKKSKTKKLKSDPNLIKLLKGEIAMLVRANTVNEINDMVDLSMEQGFDLVIQGGIEAWVLADKLAAAGVGVIYTPRSRRNARKGRENETGSFVESPRIFQDKGIPFSLATLSSSISMNGLAGRDLTSLPLEAAFAVRGGADERTALEAMTITPARMLGLQDRIGSLEEGKDADILILNGSPLDYRTYVEQAIVSGKVAYDRQKDKVYPLHDHQ